MDTRQVRPYQAEAIRAVHDGWKVWDREILVMATGTGKTYTAKKIIENRLKVGPVLFIAHRDELIEQARATFGDAGKIKGQELDIRPVTVASVQTLARRPRYEGFRTLVIDEAHHAVSESYQKILETYSDAKVLGLTATPDRKGLGNVFDGIAYEYGLRQAVLDGYLSPIVARTIPINIDLSKLKTRMGDFEVSGMADTLEPYLDEIADAMVEHCMDRKTIVFLPLVSMAQEFAERLNGHGFRAMEVNGQSPDRKETLGWFSRAGKGSVLCNAMLLTEGYDCPDVDCIVCLRPTKVRSLYCLDEETEVLTRDGWKADAEVGEEVLAFDRDTGETRFVPVLEKVRRRLDPDEFFCSISGQSCDIRVTNHHRMLYDHKGRRGWKLKEAQDLAQLRDGAYIPVSGMGKFPGVPLTDDEIRFIGWVMTDGTINKRTNTVAITQSKHQPWCEAIQACIDGCNLKYGRHEVSGGTQFNETSPRIIWTISKGKPRGTHKDRRGWGYLEEYVSKDISPRLHDMDERQFDVLLETIHQADGAKQSGQYWTQRSYHIGKGNKTFIETLQIMAIQRGYRASVSFVPAGRNGRKSDFWTLHLKKTCFVRVGSQSGQHSTWNLEPHTDEACWCVQNELGTLVTRHNGKVAIVGNCQIVGRGTRLAPGKENCLVLDFLWLSTQHDLCRPASLVTDNDDDAQRVSEKLVDGEMDIFEAERDVVAARCEALAARLEANRRKKAKLVDPLTFFVDINEIAIADYTPEFAWEKEAPTQKQIAMIESAGIDPTGMTKGKASKVIDAIIRRRNDGLATAKQMRCLERYGFANVGLWTFDQASDMIGKLAANRWRVPYHINPATYDPRKRQETEVVEW